MLPVSIKQAQVSQVVRIVLPVLIKIKQAKLFANAVRLVTIATQKNNPHVLNVRQVLIRKMMFRVNGTVPAQPDVIIVLPVLIRLQELQVAQIVLPANINRVPVNQVALVVLQECTNHIPEQLHVAIVQ